MYKNSPLQKIKFKVLFVFIAMVMATNTTIKAADEIPERPTPARLVNNFSKAFTNFLSADETIALEQKLIHFSDSTSNQIAIIIIDDLGGYEASDFSFRLGEKWGIGQNKFNNGIVLLIKPTGAAGKRAVFIAVGYGLEGAIPDITAKQIVENEIIPNFKKGNNYKALDAATTVLMALAKGEYNSSEYAKRKDNKATSLIFMGILLLLFFFMLRRKGNNKSYTIGNSGFVMGSILGSSFGGHSSSHSNSSFGGFGGGGFGGGGAGGNW